MTTYFTLIATIVLVVVFFLVFREIINWYYKINERIKLQEETNYHLEKIVQILEKQKDEEMDIESWIN